MDSKMFQALNDQINEELYSSYLYRSMSTWFEANQLKGFAAWMKGQANEETAHAEKFMEYLEDRGHQPVLKAIQAPPHQWKSPLQAFEATLVHEKHITECIYRLVEQAQKLKDHATVAFLTWFVSEQVEEEKNADELVQKMRMAGDSVGALMQLDGHVKRD